MACAVALQSGCVLLPAGAIVGSSAAGAAGAGAILAAPDNCVPSCEMHEWASKKAIEWGVRKPCLEGSTTPPPFVKDAEKPETERPEKPASEP